MKIRANSLTENITSLVSLKGLEYLLNFILLPYLVRVLGPERFGAIAFMQSIIQYFVILVDYGFNLTAPQDIAKAADNKQVGNIFSNVMATKLCICVVVTILFLVLTLLFNLQSKLDIILFWTVYTMVVGNIVFPIWFFQGIQQMRYITFVNILARSITVVLVFTLVKQPADYIMAALFQAGTTIFAGIFAFIVLLKKYPFIFVMPSWCSVKDELCNGWHIFLSTIAINVYTTSDTVILGIFTNNTVVGYFSAANKIIDSIKGLLSTVTQAVYPHVNKLAQESQNKALVFLHKLLKIYCGFNLICSLLLIIFAWFIVKILFGTGYEPSILILQVLGTLPFIISLSNVFGIQTMLTFGHQKAFSKILVCAAVFSLLIVAPLTQLLDGLGVAITMVLTELFITLAMFYYVKYVARIDIINVDK